jgi:hypothetical protein
MKTKQTICYEHVQRMTDNRWLECLPPGRRKKGRWRLRCNPGRKRSGKVIADGQRRIAVVNRKTSVAFINRYVHTEIQRTLKSSCMRLVQMKPVRGCAPRALIQASHWRTSRWILSLKNYLGCRWNHCTIAALTFSSDLKLQPFRCFLKAAEQVEVTR